MHENVLCVILIVIGIMLSVSKLSTEKYISFIKCSGRIAFRIAQLAFLLCCTPTQTSLRRLHVLSPRSLLKPISCHEGLISYSCI